MEDHQSTNESSGVALYEEMLDEDEARLIIDEACLPSEDNHVTGEQESRLLKLKLRKDVQETSNTYPCPDCGKMFRRKVKLQAHLLTHKSKEELECENCGRKFRKVDSLFNHVCSGFSNNYKCLECDEWFRLKKDLAVHQQNHKKASTSDMPVDEKDPIEELNFSSFVASFVKWPVTCTHCGVELSNLENYNVHMTAHKEGGPCVCLVCKMRFLCRDDYLLHKDLCHIEGIFECTCCSKRFHTEKKLNEHLESHSGEGVCCDICGVSFVSKDKLASHMKVHKTNIFVCAKCKKIFKSNSSLKNHTCLSENSEKKFYTFADIPEKKVNEQCLDSLSANEESDSEDAEICQVVSESHLCRVCGDSFEQKEGLITHLATHFQCIECKKYFKSQTDLDMHTFLLAEEKLYSCCLCETVVHGKKELEYHLSHHLASDDMPFDDLDLEDSTEVFQNVTPTLDAVEPLQSTSIGKPVSNVKIHKVIPAGSNTLKCSSCGKLVVHHNLSANIESNTSLTDSDEEYVYISRLGSPQNKLKQTEETYCTCFQGSDVLSSLSEQSPSKSLSEYECQEAHKIISTSQISTHLHSPMSTLEESVDSKSKSLLSEIIEDSSVVQLDINNDKGSNPERPNDFENMKPEMEARCKALLNSTRLLNKDSITSPASSISDLVAKKDCKNRSDSSKLSLPNVDTKRQGIKVIKLDNKTESLPQRADMKELVISATTGNGSVLAKPVKILVSTGIFSAPAVNIKDLGTVSELLNGSDAKKSVSGLKNSGTKRLQTEVNTVNQEELVLSSLKRKDGSKSVQENPLSIPKKIKEEKSTKNVSSSKLIDGNRIELVPTQSNRNALKTSKSKKLTLESKSHRVKGEKRKNVNQQVLNPSCAISEVMEAKLVSKPKALGKTKPLMLRINDKKARPPKRTRNMKREQGKNRIRPESSTPNANGNETCYIPETNMTFKVEKLVCESDEDDEEEPLDFSGIKKEFLASDVFIKEEEWDIVDF